MSAFKETTPESIPTAKSRQNGNGNGNDAADSTTQDDVDYRPRWASSSNNKYALDDSDQLSIEEDNVTNDDDRFLPVNELPSFADVESKELHREIKLLEQRREDAAKSARSHRERREVINDQVHCIQQEIEHTNSLVAAKKDEIETEEHLLSLSQRELGQSTRDILRLDNGNIAMQKTIARCKKQLVSAREELEKLKTDLNLNQEELEQWATAATKKEEENLLLQKYTMADELKIKELMLTIEDLTKVSVEKKSLLENEVTETQSNQTELDKLAERFKSRHEERRHLIQQWKDTIESMNNRDQAINLLAAQYEKLSQQEDEAKITLAHRKRHHEMLGDEQNDLQQGISYKERLLQTKRQDLSSLQEAEGALRTETDSLRRENSASAATVDTKKSERKMALRGLEQKKEYAESLVKILNETKFNLSHDTFDTKSSEKIIDTIQKSLESRVKELHAAEKNIAVLRQKMHKDSQKLAELRRNESDLISDINCAHANMKNYSSKINELELKRSQQQEILHNANFQLQQMEKKVSRGLGERSKEEQQKLLARIDELEKEVASEKQKKTLLIQQHRKLQAQLRKWKKKHELFEAKYNETIRKIDDVDLEIYASEQCLKETVSRREEAMVSHDVTLLDVRRLRDTLRNQLEEVHSLKQQDVESLSSMKVKKDEALSRIEINMGQLRSRKEERHKTAIDAGKLKMALEKVKSKCDLVRSINLGKDDGEGFESPELQLIIAAQKREELQQEGDALDETIRRKEMEIRTLKKTLTQLRSQNTNFRSSLSKADMNGSKAQELKRLEAKTEESEESLIKVRKELQVLQKCITEDNLKLDEVTKELAEVEERNQMLQNAKDKYESDLREYHSSLDDCNRKVSALQEACGQNKCGQELQLKKFTAEMIHIQSDRICKLLRNLGEEFPELREDIKRDMIKDGLVD